MSETTLSVSCGFHYGVPFEQYQAWDAVNCSKLKPFKKTPLHARWEMDHPKESEAMDVGSALHVSILEPARFEKEFCLGREEYNATTKEGKAIRDAEIAEAAGRTYIRRKANENEVSASDIEGMASTVRKFKAPAKLLDMPGQCEVSALWKDETTGLFCKARFDKLVTNPEIILEIKTTRDASEWGFSGQCAKLGYASQAAYYLWAHRVLTGKDAIHCFLAIESKAPWAAACYTLDDASLQTGLISFRKWLDTYSACSKLDIWPGYADKIQELSLPRWANAETYD